MNPQPNPQNNPQLQLEERRVGKILLDLIDTRARTIAREEIASMSGLVLRRCQNEKGIYNEAVASYLASIFGELLRDYSQTTDEPGGDVT